MSEWKELEEAAKAARKNAHCPYSKYPVGAAILDEEGRIHAGCNIENVSFGATICAERVALGKMVADGGKRVRMMALVTSDGGTPCGICLQCLLEFNRDSSMAILIVGDKERRMTTLHELMPQPFASFHPQ